MKFIKKLLLGLAIAIILLVIGVATRPADFRVERSATIAATPAALFAQVNDHHKFAVWNPWLKLDPNEKNTYRGPDSGVGAVCSWDGNSDIGAGSATITESKPDELVRQRMDWKRPMEGTSTVDFTFKPEGDKFLGVTVPQIRSLVPRTDPLSESGLLSLLRYAIEKLPDKERRQFLSLK